MSDNEIIERLCAVVSEMSAIISTQATFIEEQITVDEAVKADFAAKLSSVNDELSEICERTSIDIPQ